MYHPDQPTQSEDFPHLPLDTSKSLSDFTGNTFKYWVMEGKTGAFAESGNMDLGVMQNLVADLNKADNDNVMKASVGGVTFPPSPADPVRSTVSGNRIEVKRQVFLSWRGQNTGKALDGKFIGYLNADSTQIVGRWTFFYWDAALEHPSDARIFYADETMHLPSGVSNVPEHNYAGGLARGAVVLDWLNEGRPDPPDPYLQGFPMFYTQPPMVLVGVLSARVNLAFELQADSFVDGDNIWTLVKHDQSLLTFDGPSSEENWVLRSHLGSDGSVSGKFLLGWKNTPLNGPSFLLNGILYYEMDFTPTDLPYSEWEAGGGLGTGLPGF